MCRYEQLITALETLAAHLDQHAERSIGEISTELKDNALSVTSILITLPFLQPFPIGLFALIGSAAYWSIALQLLNGQQQLNLPNKVKRFKLKVSTTKKLIRTCLWVIRPIHRIAKPRLNFLTHAPRLNKLGSLIFFAVGVLVAIPLGGIVPFRNFFPALAVLLYTIAAIKKDGLLVIAAMFCILITICLYGFIFYLVWQFGALTLDHFNA